MIQNHRLILAMTFCLLTALGCEKSKTSNAGSPTGPTTSSNPTTDASKETIKKENAPALKTDAVAAAIDTSRPTQDDSKRAEEAVRGYYKALVERDYASASGFVHPLFVKPLRERFMKDLQAATPAQQKATLKTMGLSAKEQLTALTPAKFFQVFAGSKYGKGLHQLSDPAAKTRVSTTKTTCRDDIAYCSVDVRLDSLGVKGPQINEFPVSAMPRGGFWLIGSPEPKPAVKK